MQRIVGVDVGNAGAFCILTPHEDGVEVSYEPMPIIRSVQKTGKKTKTTTQLDFVSLAYIFGCLTDAVFFVEKVHALPKQGVVSMFNFGQHVGALRALLHSHQISHYEVTPQAWQKIMHVGISPNHDPKQRSLIAVQQVFPNEVKKLVREGRRVPDEGFIDALLIAEYGRRFLKSHSVHT